MCRLQCHSPRRALGAAAQRSGGSEEPEALLLGRGRRGRGGAAHLGEVLSDGVDAREDGRVGVVEEDVERVRRQVGEVVLRELLEARDERLWLLVRVDRVAVGLVLVGARAARESDLEEGVDRRKEHLATECNGM